VVTGEKGSGKTGLRIKLESLVRLGHLGKAFVSTIDFKSGDFETFEAMLNALSNSTDIDPQRLLRSYWEFLIVVEAARDLASVEPQFKRLLQGVQTGEYTGEFLRSDQDSTIPPPTLGHYMRKLIEWACTIFEGRSESKSHAQSVTDVLSFPLQSNDYRALYRLLCDYLDKTESKIWVLLDGFDVFYVGTTSSEHIRNVFDSLLDAVLTFATSAESRQVLLIKALIPHDRMVSSKLRDRDKLRSRQLRIRWDPEKLQEFARARINESLNTSYRDFSTAWRQIMPQTLTNRTYRVEEPTFEYILRHTMWRPRHLQAHLQSLAAKMEESERAPVERLIEVAVRESCERLASDFITEYLIDHPQLEFFLSRLRRRANIMRFSEFTNIVKDWLREVDQKKTITISETLRVFFKIGIFGAIETTDQTQTTADAHPLPRRAGVERYRCLFFYKMVEPLPGFPQLADNDEVAIHPMFFDYCQMRPDPTRLVG
jgi:hypothetical protein